MKRLLIYTLFSLAVLSGCKKDEEQLIDGQRPEERLTEALTAYKEQLTGSSHGWKAYLYPAGGGGYAFYLNFSNENRVTMLGDLDYDPAENSSESSYRLKAIQAPTLSFDTYNYMHLLADPDETTFGGVRGWGYYSDFEFVFDQQSGDTLKLHGKLLDSKLVMVRATQAEKEAYNNKGLLNAVSTAVDYFQANNYLYVTLGDATRVQTSFNIYNKVFSLTWNDAGTTITNSAPFVFTLTGILLQNPVAYKDKLISEFLWDPETGTYYATVGGTRVDVIVSSTPIIPLASLIGINYSGLIIPNATNYPGWSADFQTRRAAAAATMLAGPYRLRLDRMVISFNTTLQSMTLTADIYQSATRFTGIFPYSYTKTADGVFKFTAEAPAGNGALIVADMAPLTTQRLNADRFTLEYFIHPTTGEVLGQFKSVEHPEFTFSGSLQ